MRLNIRRRALGGLPCYSEPSIRCNTILIIFSSPPSIPVEVNSHPVKAFVDSGAQQTISQCSSIIYVVCHIYMFLVSPECAEACGYVSANSRLLATVRLNLFI